MICDNHGHHQYFLSHSFVHILMLFSHTKCTLFLLCTAPLSFVFVFLVCLNLINAKCNMLITPRTHMLIMLIVFIRCLCFSVFFLHLLAPICVCLSVYFLLHSLWCAGLSKCAQCRPGPQEGTWITSLHQKQCRSRLDKGKYSLLHAWVKSGKLPPCPLPSPYLPGTDLRPW